MTKRSDPCDKVLSIRDSLLQIGRQYAIRTLSHDKVLDPSGRLKCRTTKHHLHVAGNECFPDPISPSTRANESSP